MGIHSADAQLTPATVLILRFAGTSGAMKSLIHVRVNLSSGTTLKAAHECFYVPYGQQ